jgi:hypothetical protein
MDHGDVYEYLGGRLCLEETCSMITAVSLPLLSILCTLNHNSSQSYQEGRSRSKGACDEAIHHEAFAWRLNPPNGEDSSLQFAKNIPFSRTIVCLFFY